MNYYYNLNKKAGHPRLYCYFVSSVDSGPNSRSIIFLIIAHVMLIIIQQMMPALNPDSNSFMLFTLRITRFRVGWFCFVGGIVIDVIYGSGGLCDIDNFCCQYQTCTTYDSNKHDSFKHGSTPFVKNKGWGI